MKFDNLEPVAAAAAPDILGCGEYDAAGSVVVVDVLVRGDGVRFWTPSASARRWGWRLFAWAACQLPAQASLLLRCAPRTTKGGTVCTRCLRWRGGFGTRVGRVEAYSRYAVLCMICASMADWIAQGRGRRCRASYRSR